MWERHQSMNIPTMTFNTYFVLNERYEKSKMIFVCNEWYEKSKVDWKELAWVYFINRIIKSEEVLFRINFKPENNTHMNFLQEPKSILKVKTDLRIEKSQRDFKR